MPGITEKTDMNLDIQCQALAAGSRNSGLDALRLIAAVLVCVQHTISNTGVLGYIVAITSIDVPIFFMITGFYLDSIDLKKQIKKIIKIIIEMFALYILLEGAQYAVAGKWEYFLGLLASKENILRFVVYNDPVVADHSWYLFALLYSFPIIYALVKRKKKGLLVFLMICTFIYSFAFGKYSVMIFGRDYPSYFTRSFVGGYSIPYSWVFS